MKTITVYRGEFYDPPTNKVYIRYHTSPLPMYEACYDHDHPIEVPFTWAHDSLTRMIATVSTDLTSQCEDLYHKVLIGRG